VKLKRVAVVLALMTGAAPAQTQAPLDVAARNGYLERPVQAADIMWAVPAK
jgi:hypothetical protein